MTDGRPRSSELDAPAAGPAGREGQTPDLLLVEDDAAQATALAELLAAGWRVTHVATLEAARAILRGRSVDLVLLDLNLPDSQGLDSVIGIRGAAGDVPLVVMTGVDDERVMAEAARTGADGYLVKGTFRFELVEHTLTVAREHHRRQQRLESTNARLEREVRLDPLTLALNRRGLEGVLDDEVARAQRSYVPLLALLIDLDDFKEVNDTLGHAAGDAVLVEVARRVRGTIRRTDHLARVGGDEFLALFPDTRPGEGRLLAEKVRRAISEAPLDARGTSLRVTASLGLAPVADASIDRLLVNTGVALVVSKGAGKDRVSTGGGEQEAGAAAHQVDDLIQALGERGRLQGRAGPVVGVRDERVVGYEILARSTLPGLESPVDFFRVALEGNRLTAIDLRCFQVCCDTLKEVPGGWRVYLNVLPQTLVTLGAARLLEMLCLEEEPREVCIDISEAQIVGDPSYLEEPIARLREAGVTVAIDDATWNQRCLETLILLRPEMVKLDAGLLLEAEAGGGVLRRMAAIGRHLGAEVLAKGVRTRDQLELVREVGIERAQGPLWPLRVPPVPPPVDAEGG